MLGAAEGLEIFVFVSSLHENIFGICISRSFTSSMDE